MAIYSKNGKYYNTLNGIENGEFVTYNPTHQMMLDWGYELYIPQKTERAAATEQRHNLIRQINNIKQQLAETDYIALKAIEGYDCDKLYPNWRQERSELRNTINELEEQVLQLDVSISEMPVDVPIVIEPSPEPHPVETVNGTIEELTDDSSDSVDWDDWEENPYGLEE